MINDKDTHSIETAVTPVQKSARDSSSSGGGWINIVFLLTLAALFLIPHFYSVRLNGDVYFGLPRVFGGDEPHYLLIINSLLRDGDLNLRNNYDSASTGSPQAGTRWAGYPMDHHTVWFDHGKRFAWGDVFSDVTGVHFQRYANGACKLIPRSDVTPPPEKRFEASIHPVGLFLLISGILCCLPGMDYIEPGALLCSWAVLFGTMLMFRQLLRHYSSNLLIVNGITAIVFLGTPLWHYGRTFFTEPYLTFCAVTAFSCGLKKKMPVLCGLMIGIGMTMKPPFGLVLLPLLVWYFMDREWTLLLRLCIGPFIATVLVLYMNWDMYGSPWLSAQPWKFGSSPGRGMVGLLFSKNHGLVMYAPVILLAFFGWPVFLREHRREGISLLAASGLYFGLMALWKEWEGGWCYGPRLILPIIPLLLVGLVSVPQTRFWRSDEFRFCAMAICILSLVINTMGSLLYWMWWGSHPILL